MYTTISNKSITNEKRNFQIGNMLLQGFVNSFVHNGLLEKPSATMNYGDGGVHVRFFFFCIFFNIKCI